MKERRFVMHDTAKRLRHLIMIRPCTLTNNIIKRLPTKLISSLHPPPDFDNFNQRDSSIVPGHTHGGKTRGWNISKREKVVEYTW